MSAAVNIFDLFKKTTSLGNALVKKDAGRRRKP